jgi:glycosyltransferase involved in cell wall biosynthesis
MKSPPSIAFISDLAGAPWGGSEELWASAALCLARAGVAVNASVRGWSQIPARVRELAAAGVDVQIRSQQHPLWRKAWQKLSRGPASINDSEISNFLTVAAPRLVVISDPATTPPIGLLQECVSRRMPFVTISQANSEQFWPEDIAAAHYRRLLPAARRCFFVSRANLKLFETQICADLPNADVIRNPFNVDYDVSPLWRQEGVDGPLRLACVGRLHPPSKGQDILLSALATEIWRKRNWTLTFYGEGPMRDSVERMISRSGLSRQARIAGYANSIEDVWAQNHVLAMPSRYEGLPLAVVEAMLCSRPVIATNVAGHAEVIDDGVNGYIAGAPTVPSMANALERLWTARGNLKEMGELAGRRIRELVPRDPAQTLADTLKSLI